MCVFPQDPATQSLGQWAGGKCGRKPERLERPDQNGYFCVSTLRDDPDTGGSPRRAELFDRMFVLVVDDVGPKLDPQHVDGLLGAPSYRLETSPGNEQWGYFLELPETDVGRADALIRGAIKALAPGGRDPGMASVVRYVRLPVGTNTKGSLARPFRHVLHDFYPRRMFTVDELAAALGVALPAPGLGRVGRVVVPVRAGDADADPVYRAMLELGAIQDQTSSAWGYHCTCPCADTHTDPTSSTGTAYRPGVAGRRGAWKCHHGHCEDRTWEGFAAGLDAELARAGRETMRQREFSVVGAFELRELEADPHSGFKPREAFLSEYVFVSPQNSFYSMAKRDFMSRQAVNLMRGKELAGHCSYTVTNAKGVDSTRTVPVDIWFAGQAERQEVEGLSYWPGRAPVFEHAGGRWANTWHAPVLARQAGPVSHAQIRPWLDLVSHVMHAEGRRVLVALLDWCAAIVGAPSFKPAWMVLVHGSMGIGKDLMMTPVVAAVGEDNCSAITGAVLASSFTGYAARRMVLVSELRQTSRGSATGHDQYNRIKSLVDNTQETITINPKYGKEFCARNTLAVYSTTNEHEAMALDGNDRRVLVAASGAVRWPGARYQAFVAWRDSGGMELVAQWLAERWAAMPAGRRGVLSAHAPATAGKRAMVAATEDPILAWVRDRIADDATAEWPDVLTAEDATANISRAMAGGVSGLARHLHVPSVDRMGRMLLGLGAVAAAGGQQVRLRGNRKVRMWVIRNQENLASLGGAAIGRLVDAGRVNDFGGAEIIAGIFDASPASEASGTSEAASEAEKI